MIARRTFLAALILIPAVARAADPSAQQIVAAVDELRLPATGEGAYRMTYRMVDGVGARQTTSKAQVLVRGGSSLVEIKEGASRGMKFLGTAQGFWMYAPNTRRAMRLTPQQMLFGNASVGDISRMRFADDYSAAFAATPSASEDGRAIWVIELKAKSPAATYASVTLKVAKAGLTPISADLFAISGRKLKSVVYGPPAQISGQRAMTSATYIDAVNPAKRTLIEFVSGERSNAPAGLFKPEALPSDF